MIPPRHPFLLLLLALLAGPLAGCFSVRSDHDVLISSEPPGAQIFLDGENTGLTTPAMVSWGWWFGSDHDVVLKKAGYRDASRHLYHHHRQRTSMWIDGVAGVDVWAFPIFWTTSDFLIPIGVFRGYSADEVLVQLQPSDQPALGDGTVWR